MAPDDWMNAEPGNCRADDVEISCPADEAANEVSCPAEGACPANDGVSYSTDDVSVSCPANEVSCPANCACPANDVSVPCPANEVPCHAANDGVSCSANDVSVSCPANEVSCPADEVAAPGSRKADTTNDSSHAGSPVFPPYVRKIYTFIRTSHAQKLETAQQLGVSHSTDEDNVPLHANEVSCTANVVSCPANDGVSANIVASCPANDDVSCTTYAVSCPAVVVSCQANDGVSCTEGSCLANVVVSCPADDDVSSAANEVSCPAEGACPANGVSSVFPPYVRKIYTFRRTKPSSCQTSDDAGSSIESIEASIERMYSRFSEYGPANDWDGNVSCAADEVFDVSQDLFEEVFDTICISLKRKRARKFDEVYTCTSSIVRSKQKLLYIVDILAKTGKIKYEGETISLIE